MHRTARAGFSFWMATSALWACGGDPPGTLVRSTGGATTGTVATSAGGSGGSGGVPTTGGAGQPATTTGSSGVSTGSAGGSSGVSSSGAVQDAGARVPFVPLEPIHVVHCDPGGSGLAQPQIDALRRGGAPGQARLVYPYDGTAFPRGLESPLIMWDGLAAAPEAVRVHVKSEHFEYEGCLVPSPDGSVQIPGDVWKEGEARTGGRNDPYRVELTWLVGGQPVGPVSQSWIVAQATLKGSVYYNSYNSQQGTLGGAVFRIPPGGQAEPFVALECNGCHSVSANGERMTSMTLALGGRTYDLRSGSAQQRALPPATPYAALYPDGSRFVTNSLEAEVARSLVASATTTLLGGLQTASTLYDTDTGNVLPSSGIPSGALMPSFSPDGRFLVFTDNAIRGGHGLAQVQFDAATNTASGYRKLFEETSLRPGWPFYLPDNQAVVFVLTDGLTFCADGAGIAGAGVAAAPYSELFMVDADTGQATLLARAMGYASEADAAAGRTYLPHGAQDTQHVYFPTVSPVAAGGFFWVFFDTLRHYGNRGVSRQLWAAGIEISPTGDYGRDRSFPAFYLPGQEWGAGNHRAFTALDPCKEDGGTCSTGVECCGGTCVIPEGEFAIGTCEPSEAACAVTDEACESDLDCCPGALGESHVCIAGFCAPVPLF